MKFTYSDCYDSSFSDELLTKFKKATVNAVNKLIDEADDDQALEDEQYFCKLLLSSVTVLVLIVSDYNTKLVRRIVQLF